jgi:hypothetical protein
MSVFPSDPIAIRGCSVSAVTERGGTYLVPKVGTRSLPSSFQKHIESSKYQVVLIDTEGRSVHEATNNAINALHLLRGIWSFFATRGSWSIKLGAVPHEAIAAIHTGPIYTLHFPDGTHAVDRYWYEPEYQEDKKLFEPRHEWTILEKHRTWAMKNIASWQYTSELEDLLIRYSVALDQTNPDNAFLQMWSILEKMTNTVGANYDETVRRAVWFYADQDRGLTKDILESLRFCRNRLVHAGKGDYEGDQVVYQLKVFIDQHLLRLIANDFRVKTLAEYGQMLALSTSVQSLKAQRRKISRAFHIRTKASAAEKDDDDNS